MNEDQDEAASSIGSDLGTSLEHRNLKHKAGVAADRPLTRSSVKPRLLFPSEADERARDARAAAAADYVDEEALTDIEVPVEHTPPPTIRKTNKKRSPFDSWQRTKGGLKRPNDSVAEGSQQKRTRAATNDTPT